MNELVVADRASESRGLKALVLDSVSSPITRAGLQPQTRRIHCVVYRGAAARRIHEGDP